MSTPFRQIRATYTTGTITVYQAYGPHIARSAVAAGRFVPPFSRGRMTWIKPSFFWMMYRSGWATRPGQEHVLAVEISRVGFEWFLAHACLSHYDRDLHTDRESWQRHLKASPVRIQWDPERSPRLAPLPHRSLQIGLSGEAVTRYLDEWTVGITDVTELAHRIRDTGDATLFPPERPYPLPPELATTIAATG